MAQICNMNIESLDLNGGSILYDSILNTITFVDNGDYIRKATENKFYCIQKILEMIEIAIDHYDARCLEIKMSSWIKIISDTFCKSFPAEIADQIYTQKDEFIKKTNANIYDIALKAESFSTL